MDWRWPVEHAGLVAEQARLSAARPPLWAPSARSAVGACHVCFAREGAAPGEVGEPGWAGAARKAPGARAHTVVVAGRAGAAYRPGLLALREGPLRERAVRALAPAPDVLLVDATGRDHPRGAGLALHLGAVLGIPTVGVTDRPLVAAAAAPAGRRGATGAMTCHGDLVGYAVRTRAGVRPVYVSAGWRTSPDVAVDVVLRAARRHRTPQPLREARRAARHARGRA